ncbi:MAG: putative ABC transport system substrate-binding protein [Motiliproteus sp.]|jgi:putative ABC transport system substrate-binding protein
MDCLVLRGSPEVRRPWWRVVQLLWLLLPASSWAGPSVLLVLSQDSPPYRDLASALVEQLPQWQVQSLVAEHYSPTAVQTDLIVTLGAQAALEVLQQPLHWPVLTVLIPRQTFASLSQQPHLLPRLEQGLLSAIYLEQPVARQLQLARLIRPSIKQMGVVVGPSSHKQLPSITASIQAQGWTPRLARFSANENPIKLLEPLSESSDAILVVPDKAEFNRSISKWLLLLSYRRNIPLIGFSSRYVDAGATAAVFSTPASIARDTVVWLRRLPPQTLKLPAPAFPAFFEIRTNPKAAQSIGLVLAGDDEIHAMMSRNPQP